MHALSAPATTPPDASSDTPTRVPLVSAYLPGLPVYAAAETYAKAERAIRTVLMRTSTHTRTAGPMHVCAWPACPTPHGQKLISSAPRLSWARIGAR